MFPAILITLASLLGFGPPEGGVPESHNPAPAKDMARAKDDSSPTAKRAARPLPFAAGTELTYLWTYRDQDAGKTELEWKPVATEEGSTAGADPQAPAIVVQARFEYSAMGRRLFAQSVTRLRSDLRPLDFEQTMRSFTSGISGGRKIEVEFEAGGLAKISTTELGVGRTDQRDHRIAGEFLIYESQAFEHFVLAATRLVDHESVVLRLFMPSNQQLMEIRFNREPRQEGDPGDVRRWKFHHPTFAGTLLVTEDGLLREYQQEDTRIRLRP